MMNIKMEMIYLAFYYVGNREKRHRRGVLSSLIDVLWPTDTES